MGIKKINLSDALFSKVQQRLLGLLYSQPSVSFHTNEIIRLTHAGTGAVQRELRKMTITGLLLTKQVGNQKHYQANQAGPIFKELCSIVIKTFGLTDIIQQGLQPLKEKIHVAFIYGSIAKQEDTVNSDIDLMIISDNLSYADLFPLIEKIEAKLHRPINPTFYSPSEWLRKLKKHENFLLQIIKQPKIYVIGSQDELNKLGKFSSKQ